VRTASRGIDRIDVVFDDPNSVANAGLILAGTLIKRLGLEALINDWVRLTGREGGSGPGRKVLTMVCAIRRWGDSHRSRRHLAGGGDAAGVAVSGDGTLDDRDVPAGVHVRSCPPTRRRRGPGR
jgi:hypothetical protein